MIRILGIRNFFENQVRLEKIVYGSIFICLVTTATIIRLPYLYTESMGSDDALYAWSAKRIAQNPSLIFSREIIEYHPPLFPVLLTIGHFFPNGEIGYRAVVLSLSLLGIVVVYILGARLRSRFLGIFAALLLGFNYLYLLTGVQILTDMPATVFFMGLLLLLANVNGRPNISLGIGVGIMGSLLILLKWSMTLVVPFLIFYYLWAPWGIPIRERMKKLGWSLGIVLFTVSALLINNYFASGSIWPNTETLTALGHEKRPFSYYFFNGHNVVMIPVLIPLFLFGVYAMFRDHYVHKNLLLSYLFVFGFGLSFVPVKVLRYALILIPGLLLVAGIGLENLLTSIFKDYGKRWLSMVISLLAIYVICCVYYPKIAMMLKKSLATSTGLKEAGEVLKKKKRPESNIIVENRRPTRYYTGINFKEFGGQLVVLPLQKAGFEELIKTVHGHTLLQVELWHQTPEGYPFSHSDEEEKYFARFGFKLIKKVYRPVYARYGTAVETIPVVKIFERE